jgi:serine O-acetyltransferase
MRTLTSRWPVLHLPLLLSYRLSGRRAIIDADVRRWNETLRRDDTLLELLAKREFRTLFYHRIEFGDRAGRSARDLVAWAYPGERTLHLSTRDIGPGLFIQHGFATIVSAERVGANCWINQQVTIGYNGTGRAPVLEDRVVVHAGAKVLGGMTLHEGCRVGANAVVIRDVPAGATAVGVPAHRLPQRSA